MKIFTKKSFAVIVLSLVIVGAGTITVINNNKYKVENNKVNIEVQNVKAVSTKSMNIYDNEYVKSYYDLKSVESNVGFDFKLPDYIANESKPVIYHIRKISDTDNVVQIAFDNEGRRATSFSVFIFKGEPKESIKAINETRTNRDSNFKTEVQEKLMEFDKIQGKDIGVTTSNMKDSDEQYIDKYFVWQDAGIYYAIEYSDIVDYNGHIVGDSISNDEVEKMVKSFKNLEDIKNVDYMIRLKESKEL